MMGFAEPYCERVVTTTIDYTSLNVTVTVKKQNANTVRVVLDNEHITGIRAGGTFQQWGNGVWANQDDAVANFAQGWTQDGNAWYKDFVFSTYPTTGNFQIYILMDHNAGTPAVAGFTLGSIDIDNACSGGGSTPEPEPTPATFTINTVWPDTRVSATKNGDDINVAIASYGGGQWQAQLKLEHNLSFDAKKAYKVAYSLTANKDCGGITFKTDDNNGAVYENQSIDLTANTPYNYEKVFSGQAGNNKITVFDFGWVGENTNITISDLTLVEYSPATASSINGDLIPFKAVDGNTETRWQAASTGEQWWKMDYGTAQSFNRVNITWEASYAKSFTIQGSNNDENYTTLATISGQTISTFPYKQVIDLDQIYNYRYVKFVGTENGNGYGFSFYEFEIMEVETSVLTDVVITSPKRKTVCAVGQSLDITAVARDQYEMPMDGQTISYSVSPAARGTIDANGHYTASQVGEVTITATCSNKSATIAVVNTVSGNLALNKTATAGDNETPIGNANDNNLGSFWSLGPNKTSDKWWWQVDLEETYDLSLVIIKWEGACPTEHAIQVSTDGTNWTDAATKSGWPEIGGENDHNYQFYDVNATARYIRVKATALREVAWGMKIYDFQAFGTESASPTKSVSAAVNDPTMGTATVKQNDVAVTEVETGSTVTFSAVANDGYIFVNWSNGEENATFNTEVNTNMNLTANFRALNHISCNEELTNGDYTVYVTYRKTATENEYEFIVRSAQTMTGFSNAYIGHINGNNQVNLNGQGSLTGNGHKLSYTFTSSTEPKLNTPLYVNFANHGEVTFNQINNGTVFEFAVACADPEITAIELNKTEATLDMGNTLTLVPTFTPAYMSADITWQTSNADVATVSNGVVTPVAAGNVTITAKVTEDVKATCSVTVQASTSHNWYGYGTSQDLDYTYRIEYTTDHHIVAHVKRQGNKTGLVPAQMLISGAWTTINVTEGEEEGWKKGTTEATFTAGDDIHILIQSAYAGPTSKIEFDYEVGSDNVMPTIVPSTITLSSNNLMLSVSDADVQLTAEIHHRDAANKTLVWSSDDESVATVASDGTIHPVGVGATTIHATTHNSISASCDVTIVGELDPETYWGNGTSADVAIAYSITRNADHTLTYTVEALHAKDGFGVQVNDGEYHNAVKGDDGIYRYSSASTYEDGVVINGFFYMPFAGGAARVDFRYTVGSASEQQAYIPVTFDQNAEDASWINDNDGQMRDVTIGRTLTANGNFKTLCLPFSMNAEQIAETFGDCEILMLTGGRMKSEKDIYVQYEPVNEIIAGKPYLMTVDNNVAGLDFNGVLINSSTANNEISVDLGGGKSIAMVGTFVKLSLTAADLFYLSSDGYLYSVKLYGEENGGAAISMPAFRCYYRFTGFGDNPAGVMVRVVRGTDVYTDVEDMTDTAVATKLLRDGQLFIVRDGMYYTVTGLKVK